MSVNKVMLTGRLGQDPELRMTPSGQQVATISLATSRSWMKDGKKEEETEWHRCVLWGKLAETAGKYLKKGRNVTFFGRLKTRSWDDQNGVKKYTTEVIVEELDFVEKAEGGNQAPQSQGASQSQSSPARGYHDEFDDSDVPF